MNKAEISMMHVMDKIILTFFCQVMIAGPDGRDYMIRKLEDNTKW